MDSDWGREEGRHPRVHINTGHLGFEVESKIHLPYFIVRVERRRRPDDLPSLEVEINGLSLQRQLCGDARAGRPGFNVYTRWGYWVHVRIDMYTKSSFCVHIPRTDTVMPIAPLQGLDPRRFETPAILRRLAGASRQLAELKGVAASIPHQGILINTLGMQEAKDSSAIENVVTTHDELFRDDAFPEALGSAAAKEVLRYRQALGVGFEAVRTAGLLTNRDILGVQAVLERNDAGYRRLPGTTLQDQRGRVVYTPPEPQQIPELMRALEDFINKAGFDADPLIRMALIHHQFESIHPFYDGNGRTGRIINVLYLVKEGLLEAPVLYLSRHIVRTKADYYRLLQAVRDEDAWEEWVLYMLEAVEQTAREAIATIGQIRVALFDYKHRIRDGYRFYSQDLINNLFTHPYTKIQFLANDLGLERKTAAKYLDALTDGGLLLKRKVGRSNYYINIALNAILTGEGMRDPAPEG